MAMTAEAQVQAPPPSPSSLPNSEGGEEETGRVRMVSILYSKEHDLYRVPVIRKPCWLSVASYELPVTQLAADAIYLGPSISADGKRWRKAFSTNWRSIIAGDRVTVPADDPMVADYAASQVCR
jgi:hypothetical protein